MDELNEPRFWDKPIDRLSRAQWEALCDGCGQCCLHKLEDEDTGAIYRTNVACRLLDLKSGQCSDYRHRKAQVAEAAKMFKAYYAKGEPTKDGGYLMDHARIAYLMNPDGKPLALLPIDQTADAVAESLTKWTN